MVDCPCTDANGVLASLVERSCEISDGKNGVMLAAEGPCVPHSFGAGCGRHDLLHDPKCALADSGESGTPDYCLRSWCYVDAEACKRSSDRVYRSEYFPRDQGVDLFYSYSTCNSTADDWLNRQQHHLLGGISMSVIIPSYMTPLFYKRNPAGDILEDEGNEYYNTSVPFEGSFADYLENLMSFAEGDFTFDYTYGSEAGSRAHKSVYDGAVQDIEDGLVDMAAGPFWITGERLHMTSFTVPLFYDKTVLVIPNPGSSGTAQIPKVLAPFTWGVWGLAIALIAATALISVWFSTYGRRLTQAKQPKQAKKTYYARLALDEFLQKGMFFCSAGVEQEVGATLPQKLLMFGFSFFILILVSAYVANLAAFLTRPSGPSDYVGTMEAVVKSGFKVCAHPVQEKELKSSWPNAHFLFSRGSNLYQDMIENYKAGNCQVLAAGKFDVTHSTKISGLFCEENLVFTDYLLAENPVAFPIRPGLAAGLSYWIHEGMKNHITLEAAEENYDKIHKREPICNLELPVNDLEADDYAPIKAEHLFFPIMFFVGFAILAIILQLYYQSKQSKGLTSSLGRPSRFDRRGSPFGWLRRDTFKDAHHGVQGDLDPQSMDDTAVTVANDGITSDVVQQEDSLVQNSLVGDSSDGNCSVQTLKKRVRFLTSEDSTRERANKETVRLPNSDDSAPAQLYLAIDNILDYVNEIKNQKKTLTGR